MHNVRSTPVAGDDRDLVDAVVAARRALQHAASLNPALAGLDRLVDELLQADQSEDRSAFLRLLNGDRSTDVEALGLPLDGARLIVVYPADPRHLPELMASLDGDRQLLVVNHDGRLNLLVRNLPRRAGDDRGMATALRVAMRVNRTRPDAFVGVSAPLANNVDLASAARDAGAAAQLARRRDCRVLCVDDVWGEVVVTRLRDALAGCLTTDHPLARLAEHDRRHGSDLVATVSTWFAYRCETAETARHLSLHPNTLRYRLRRAQDVSGLDLLDPSQALVAQLFCEGWRRSEAAM